MTEGTVSDSEMEVGQIALGDVKIYSRDYKEDLGDPASSALLQDSRIL